MNITIFGSTGNIGRRILDEALLRGHDVKAVVRKKDDFHKIPHPAQPVIADLSNPDRVAEVAGSSDVIINAVKPPEGMEDEQVGLTEVLLEGAAKLGIRAVIIGGAARLKIGDNSSETVLTAEGFLPERTIPVAKASQAQFELCLHNRIARWTYVSPPLMITPGERTGKYRTGTDTLILDENGKSTISIEDFAVAVLDKVENASFVRDSFTVAY